ncbi:MAG: transketolase C-terminal domain-containing protein [Candidatus Omnitrophota bacterium]
MATIKIKFIPYKEFERVRNSGIEKFEKLKILSDMCRLNALSCVKKAGSGHLGSSFSSMDIFIMLYFCHMNTLSSGLNNPDRDIFFSSKGHDCPGLYCVFFAAGIIDYDKLLNLRRLGGLDGHPDVKIPGIEANAGSLGMGISKAKGMAFAKKLNKNKGRVFVLTGDGELQEGQIWESLQTTAHQGITNVTVIVDFNKIQTDKLTQQIISLSNLEEKFRAFGWHVQACDGHDFVKMNEALAKLGSVKKKPKIIIADTVKGKGVSFMEGPAALKNGNGVYKWHSGAPDDDSYELAFNEIINRIDSAFTKYALGEAALEVAQENQKNKKRFKDSAEKVVNAYSEALVDLGNSRQDIVVLDADLAQDCGLREFELKFPERFIENGIAEQDMVSMAGGLALAGFLPIVNSFGVFLSSRANEQIYTNATEGTKIIYVCHYAGLIPAGPGKSHQSLRDISLFGALPNCVIMEPCNALETGLALNWCASKTDKTCMIRLAISPSPGKIILPENYSLVPGEGCILEAGNDAVIFAYGPVMLHEALLAAGLLRKKGFSLEVVNMPWINLVSESWLKKIINKHDAVFVLDNHSGYGALGDKLLNAIIKLKDLNIKIFEKFAIEGYPACGSPAEALEFHSLDHSSLARRILEKVNINNETRISYLR